MASGRKLIINWLIKSKAIKDDERELYEYALYSIVLLLSPAFISIAIGCIMGIPINGVLMVIPFLIPPVFGYLVLMALLYTGLCEKSMICLSKKYEFSKLIPESYFRLFFQKGTDCYAYFF